VVFSSIIFLFYFIPILLILYAIAPKKLKNLVMIAGSFVFYAWGEIRFFTGHDRAVS
jgi:alginate O-acetyltransferase complex protein AlgI